LALASKKTHGCPVPMGVATCRLVCETGPPDRTNGRESWGGYRGKCDWSVRGSRLVDQAGWGLIFFASSHFGFLVGTTCGPRHESDSSLSSRNAWPHKIQIKYMLGAGPLKDEGHAANKSKEGQQASEHGSRRLFPRSPVRGCEGSGWDGCPGWAPPPGH
jgi:hypothetical protein